MNKRILPTLLLSTFLVLGCGDEADKDKVAIDGAIAMTLDASVADASIADDAQISPLDAMQSVIEVLGTWNSSFTGLEVIAETTWGAASIRSYNNDQNFAITQNPSDAPVSADKFNRLVWTEIESNIFYYCTVDFNLDTLADAENSPLVADSTQLETGCGGFAWTQMTMAAQ